MLVYCWREPVREGWPLVVDPRRWTWDPRVQDAGQSVFFLPKRVACMHSRSPRWVGCFSFVFVWLLLFRVYSATCWRTLTYCVPLPPPRIPLHPSLCPHFPIIFPCSRQKHHQCVCDRAEGGGVLRRDDARVKPTQDRHGMRLLLVSLQLCSPAQLHAQNVGDVAVSVSGLCLLWSLGSVRVAMGVEGGARGCG